MSVSVQPHRVGIALRRRIIIGFPDTAEETDRVDFEFSVDAERYSAKGLFYPFALRLRGVACLMPDRLTSQ